jgi:hypothetical protein
VLVPSCETICVIRPKPANTAPVAVASTRGSETDHPP